MADDTLPQVAWRKSSFSSINSGGSDCVEVATLHTGHIAVRDSKHPTGPVLTSTAAEWAALIAGVRAGEFDLPG